MYLVNLCANPQLVLSLNPSTAQEGRHLSTKPSGQRVEEGREE